ncbi:MAG: acetylserotonin O-methyltransferase, partial [Acidobacteriota bacterium]|nr:acetylserotonin O-methyltransferase [Acidobacteriota bacterium]
AARAISLHPVAADRFFNACVALGLLRREGGEVRNAQLSARFLVKGEPTYLGDFFLKYDHASYPRWDDLVHRLRAWRPGATDDEPPPAADQGEAGMRARHNYSLLVAHALGKSYDFSRHRVMLDLGGGTGAYSISLCRSHESLRAVVFDLPPVARLAREYVTESDVSPRVEVRAGDFKKDALPAGFDVALLADLLSVASEETNRALLREIYGRLPGGGAVIVSGWILDDVRTSPLVPVLFCLEDINWRAPDVERSASTYAGWLAEAGFVEIEHKTYCPPTSMIVGRKPVGARPIG